MTVKNSSEETVMQVTSEGKVEIADSLTGKALENTSGDESSLVGVDQHGTLIKSDQAALQEFLVFRPVDNKILVNHWGVGGLPPSDLLINSALDIETASGITLPDEATHVLIEHLMDINIDAPPLGSDYHAAIRLYMDDMTPADGWGLPTLVGYLDGGNRRTRRSYGVMDASGADEVQSQRSTIVRLSDQKTIAYKINVYTGGDNYGEVLLNFDFYFKLRGYYVPLSALLKQ